MKFFRPVRMLLLALLVSIVPATSFAGVFISVGFAPPILPVYDQPPCPEEGLMWMPGYWAYGDEGYFWVPGTWVPAPYEGALWTPPYWGWSEGIYVFHPGYWGEHVGYYGGVNYGYGYMGVGFVGGMWRGHDFVYNRAVMRVDDRYVRNTYEDRTIVERNTIVNEGHVAFSGGPGGIRHEAMPEERVGEHENHLGATSFQASHESSAMGDRNSYATQNGGHPQNVAVPRPMNQGGPPNPRGGYQSEPGGHPGAQGGYQGVYQGQGNQGRGNPGANSNQPQPYNAPNNGTNQPRNYNQPQPNNGGQESKPTTRRTPTPATRQLLQPRSRTTATRKGAPSTRRIPTPATLPCRPLHPNSTRSRNPNPSTMRRPRRIQTRGRAGQGQGRSQPQLNLFEIKKRKAHGHPWAFLRQPFFFINLARRSPCP